MNAQELYDEIKAALEYFDLRFSDMKEVEVKTYDGFIELKYKDRTIRFSTVTI